MFFLNVISHIPECSTPNAKERAKVRCDLVWTDPWNSAKRNSTAMKITFHLLSQVRERSSAFARYSSLCSCMCLIRICHGSSSYRVKCASPTSFLIQICILYITALSNLDLYLNLVEGACDSHINTKGCQELFKHAEDRPCAQWNG